MKSQWFVLLAAFCPALVSAQQCTFTANVFPSTISPTQTAGAYVTGTNLTSSDLVEILLYSGGNLLETYNVSSPSVYATIGPLPAGTYTLEPFVQSDQHCGTINFVDATLTVINPGGAGAGGLKGSYAFGAQGELKSGGAANQVAMVGSFVADGLGNINSGTVDLNSGAGTVQLLPVTGTYTLDATGAGTFNLNSSQGNLRFALYAPAAQAASSIQKAQLVENDGTVASTSGTLMLQTPASFTASKTAGSYTLGASGVGAGALHLGGELTLATGGAANLAYTLSSAGAGATAGAATGIFGALDPATGRFELELAGSGTNSSATVVGYAVDGSNLYLLTLPSPAFASVLSGSASK